MYIFQDDNTKIDQNQIVKDWPPQSPDLNPIEKPLGCARVEFTLPVQKRLNTQQKKNNWLPLALIIL